MKLKELLQQIKNIQEKIGASEPFICGGTPRDVYMHRLDNLVDIDITTGDKTVDYLSKEFATFFNKRYNIIRKIMQDGHSTIFIGNLKLDFSSNFILPNIDLFLKQKGINNPSNMQRELFSRDFTCNSLLLDFDLKNILDPTKQGIKDIKDKKIKTCLDPKITLLTNRNRVIRSIYLATKLDFDIDKSIIEFVKNNPESIKISTEKSLNEKLDAAFKYDADKASFYLSKMNLWNNVPILKSMYPYYKAMSSKIAYFHGGGGVNEPTPKKQKYKPEKKLIHTPRFEEPLYKNYDLYETEGVDGPAKHGPGTGLYSKKYKSVSDFRKNKKNILDKYVAKDLYLEPDGSITVEKKKKAIRRMALLSLIKESNDINYIDFPDDQLQSVLITNDSGIMPESNLTGGLADHVTMPSDEEGRNPYSDLDYEKEHADEVPIGRSYEKINELLNKYLNCKEPPIFGLPQGDISPEEFDHINDRVPGYGNTDSGNTALTDAHNIVQ